MKHEFFNCNCMELMMDYPDNHFDIAIADPPYGIGKDWKKSTKSTCFQHDYGYDNTRVKKDFFDMLIKKSKNQMIFGANYYSNYLKPTNSWIAWDKNRDVKKTFLSEGELAWTSFKVPFRFFRHEWDGARKGRETGITKIHPHQKPVFLYKWILSEYANDGDLILDTNLGSFSSAIAAYKMGFDFLGCEINEHYFNSGKDRFYQETSQTDMFINN